MKISVLTVFPQLYTPFLQTSLLKRAQEQGIIQPDIVSFFSCVPPKERIDAPTFGHGAGMLIRPEVIQTALEQQEQRHGRALRIFFSPHGQKLNQRLLKTIATRAAQTDHLMLVAARYEGIDARVEEVYADIIVSLGDFVLMGGDVPALAVLEGMARLIPGVVGKEESVQQESFSGAFVDYPEYTAPVVWQGLAVPEVIRSGNHAEIVRWRQNEAAQRTVLTHFDWLRAHCVRVEDRELAKKYIPPHYVILMHDKVLLPNGVVGKTSVTSFDLHDVSRSCRTFGIKNYFIATPLHDQQIIVNTLLDFWQSGVGIDYNKKRHEAVNIVRLVSGLQEAIAAIEKEHGTKPLLIATSARSLSGIPLITYNDQTKMWAHGRPILLVFGTGKGLAPELLEQCDALLGPILGFSDFNHLSVRAAVSIVLDRWLGINLDEIPENR
jgi:tRNA (guanine37-N1)-methyltransferase